MRKAQLGMEKAFFNVIFKRHSIRSFKNKPIEDWKVKQILNASNSAPSAGDLQAYEIFLVTNERKRRLLAEAAYQQEFIAEAPIVLVFAANPSRSASKYGKRGEELYALQDATIAAIYAQLSATALGLGSVWVGSFDEKSVSKILDGNDLRPVVIMPIGYAAESPELTPRRKIEDLSHII